ncbi:uncharacterized protein EAF01_007856 [Botrytis porri]|uniref:uncharacterized protein n=1 Tax=Botrytis porri TaxID=87229 RepID=UPI0019003AB2|nr:uncharacterized protein EAF01_007856 [Botrytis porri]KAF7900554.1 hypothetical protein EAF01_007856 [Botrytis porri]
MTINQHVQVISPTALYENDGKTSGSWKFIPHSSVLALAVAFGSPTNIYIPSSPRPPLLASHHSPSPLHNPSQDTSRPSDRASPKTPLPHDSSGATGIASAIQWHNLNPHPPICRYPGFAARSNSRPNIEQEHPTTQITATLSIIPSISSINQVPVIRIGSSKRWKEKVISKAGRLRRMSGYGVMFYGMEMDIVCPGERVGNA